ncbi:uncharacterized protein [Argopecten irradians]|uniref:uncharacterized protein isoform X1 n=1 Tax=Argopecten irradians TaxID=31199 RepID=UPI00371A30B2
MIQLLKLLTERYVPCKDGKMVEPVFLGGDRLTDERVQSAQNAMRTAETDLERLEGFISKTEDFHRLMNFLEAIHKLTFNTGSGNDEGTVFYFRTILNMRNVKGEVKNSYRPYKLLYYTILDGLCLVMFYHHFRINDLEENIPLPDNFSDFTDQEKILWLNNISREILQTFFFENSPDILSSVREVLEDPDHPENYWTSTIQNNRSKCHFCDKTYARIGSLKAHEAKVHNSKMDRAKPQTQKSKDELFNYILMLFKLVMLHKNLDSAVDMGDGERSIRSAKYELPIYNKTNKIKYVIGSIHLTALTSGVLPHDQSERLVANRFVNVQGGKNNNIACDEYIEMMNRDSKNMCRGNQTKSSIIRHSKEYPILMKFMKQFDTMNASRKRKGFHHLPSYQEDVKKVAKVLISKGVLTETPGRQLKCRSLCTERDLYSTSMTGLSTMIHRHKPTIPVRRLRSSHV